MVSVCASAELCASTELSRWLPVTCPSRPSGYAALPAQDSLHSRLSTLTGSFGEKWLAPEDTKATYRFQNWSLQTSHSNQLTVSLKM